MSRVSRLRGAEDEDSTSQERKGRRVMVKERATERADNRPKRLTACRAKQLAEESGIVWLAEERGKPHIMPKCAVQSRLRFSATLTHVTQLRVQNKPRTRLKAASPLT